MEETSISGNIRRPESPIKSRHCFFVREDSNRFLIWNAVAGCRGSNSTHEYGLMHADIGR